MSCCREQGVTFGSSICRCSASSALSSSLHRQSSSLSAMMPSDVSRDNIQDSFSSGSPTIRRANSILMLLNEEPPLSQPLPTIQPSSSKRARFDPVHNPDAPSSPSVETPRPSSSSSAASGFFSNTSPIMSSASGLALPVVKPSLPPSPSPFDPVRHASSTNPRGHPPHPTPHSDPSPLLHHRSITSSPTMSSGPLSASPRASPITAHAEPSSPAPPVIIYNPKSRITPQKSVLIPISQQEIERLKLSSKNPLRKTALQNHHLANMAGGRSSHHDDGGSRSPVPEIVDGNNGNYSPSMPPSPPGHVASSSSSSHDVRAARDVAIPRKRPAPTSDSGPSLDSERLVHPSQRTGQSDVVAVQQHYNARPEVGKIKRQESPILGLKNFNNWIKAVLIAKFARPVIQATNSNSRVMTLAKRPKYSARVLDMGCGKGGDLNKWAKAEIGAYVGVDIADVSIEQAKQRFAERRQSFQGNFYDLDCFQVSFLPLFLLLLVPNAINILLITPLFDLLYSIR